MTFGKLLLILFILLPVAEIATFIQVGGWIGLWPTVLLILLTAIAGSTIIRMQGQGLLMRARTELDAGRMPMSEMFQGLCLFVAGVLMVTPGFITDIIGFALLVPLFRHWLSAFLARHIEVFSGKMGTSSGFGAGRPGAGSPQGEVIDVDFVEIHEEPSGISGPDSPPKDRD